MDDSEQTLRETPAAFGDPSHLPHGEPNLTPLAQLKRMQRVLYAAVVDPNPDKGKVSAFAQASLAWERLEGRKAVLTGKPGTLTGRVEPEKRKPRDTSEPDHWKPRKRGPAAPAPAPAASSSSSAVVPATGQPITPQQIEESR